MYDVDGKSWLLKAAMNHRRSQYALQVLEDKMYPIGGRSYEFDDPHENTKSIEVFDPGINQWSILLKVGFENFACSAFVAENHIFLVGGACKFMISRQTRY